MADLERRQQAIPWECFDDSLEERGWTNFKRTLNSLSGTSEWQIDAIEVVDDGGIIVMTNATASITGLGDQRIADATIDERRTQVHDGSTVGTFIEITSESREDCGEPLERLLFDVTVIDPMPPSGQIPRRNATVKVSFDEVGRVRSAKHVDFGERDDKEDQKQGGSTITIDKPHQEEPVIEQTELVSRTLRRMGITDPGTQQIDTVATMRAMTDLLADKANDDTEDRGGDILGCMELFSGNTLQTYWPPFPTQEGWNPNLN